MNGFPNSTISQASALSTLNDVQQKALALKTPPSPYSAQSSFTSPQTTPGTPPTPPPPSSPSGTNSPPSSPQNNPPPAPSNRTITDTNGNAYQVDSTGQIYSGPSSGAYQVGSNINNQPNSAYLNAIANGKTEDQANIEQNNATISKNNSDLDAAHTTFVNTVAGLTNGTIPLNPGQQAQVDSLKQQYDQMIQQQQLTNTGAAGAANVRGYQTGAAEYDPMFQAKTINGIVSAGIQKVVNLQTSEAGAIAKLTQALKDDNVKAVKDAWDSLNSYTQEKDKQLQDTVDKATKAIKDAQTRQDELNKEAQAKLEQDKKDQYEMITKPIQDIAAEAAKNGASKDIIAKIGGATDVQGAINAAGDSLQTATGQLGDYLEYKRNALSSGQVPTSYADWKTKDDAHQEKLAESKAYGTAFATAAGKAAAEKKYQADTPTSPVESPLGITYNAPASIAPYVAFASNGVKYVDMSNFKGTPTEANVAVGDAQKAGYKVITNKNTALDVQNITDAMGKLGLMEKDFLSVAPESAATRDTWAAAAVTAGKLLQTNPDATSNDVYVLAALDILKAASGVQGFRGGASIVETVANTFPQNTDTADTIKQKIDKMRGLIGSRETALVGKPSASDQQLIDTSQATDKVKNYIQSNPSEATSLSTWAATPNSDGTTKTAEDTYNYLKSRGKL